MSEKPGLIARWRMRRELAAQEIPIAKDKPITEQHRAWQLRSSEQDLARRQQTRDAREIAYAMQRNSWDRTAQAFQESRERLIPPRQPETPDPFAEWGHVYGRRQEGRERDER